MADTVLLLLVLSVVQRLIGFVRASLFCRWLDPAELGRWDMSFAFLMTAGPLVVLALAGCLGRYVEYYRRRSRLRTFIRRTASLYFGLAAAGAVVVFAAAEPLSTLIFGTPEEVATVRLLAAALLAVTTFNYLYELAAALRNTRLAVSLQFMNSLLFALLGVGMLLGRAISATSVIVAYAAACSITVVPAAVWLVRNWTKLPERSTYADTEPNRFWRPLLFYSAWAWAAATLSNLFEVADRYMIVHFSTGKADTALALVGDYHASRLVPVLMVSVAALVGSIVTPHLSHDWEQGRQDRVSQRLNLLAKLFGLLLLCGGGVVLTAAPWLFGSIFGGKYGGGLAVLPLTLTYCVWFSLFLILENYVLCCERSHLVGISMAAGLVTNVALNMLLLPRFGLPGAVAATAAGNAVALGAILGFSYRHGLRFDRGTLLMTVVPGVFLLGPIATTGAIVLLAGVAVASDRILSADDKREIAAYLRSLAAKIRGRKDEHREKEETGNSGARAIAAGMLEWCAERLTGRPSEEQSRRLKVMFVITCMPVGGAETLLVELVRRLDRRRFDPEVCCLKYRGPLGELLAREIPVHTGLLAHKYDVRVLPRLWLLMLRRRVDAVVTVGTGGDKMFWGRLAAFMARVPVICSALHSTGLPDRVEWLNRRLAFLTDAFIAVAKPHGVYLAEHEGCPAQKVRVIPNGVDTDRFSPGPARGELLAEFGIEPGTPVVTIVAALRPEKNHELFLKVASRVLERLPRTHFLVVGDGERRDQLVDFARRLGLRECVHFLGTRSDIAEIWRISTVGVLTSHMEANPVSLLEAMACGKPVVAPRVGSIPETVHDGENGFLVPAGDVDAFAERIVAVLSDSQLAAKLGKNGREYVLAHWSIDRMIAGYQAMIEEIYRRKHPNVLPHETGDAFLPASQRAAPILTALLDSPWNVTEERSTESPDCCGVG
ncbi:hypothetical protein JCM19992_27940 [Thermostilla marina]